MQRGKKSNRPLKSNDLKSTKKKKITPADFGVSLDAVHHILGDLSESELGNDLLVAFHELTLKHDLSDTPAIGRFFMLYGMIQLRRQALDVRKQMGGLCKQEKIQ